MTINVVNGLLKSEGRCQSSIVHQPIKLLILNLMPNKRETEQQFINLLAHLNQDVVISFMYVQTHRFRTTAKAVVQQAYYCLDQIYDNFYDGLIVTGSPVETLDFHSVDYWNEFVEIQNWAKTHVKETINECWASQAALYNDFGINKFNLKQKIFGIYQADWIASDNELNSNLTNFRNPQSRHSASLIDRNDLPFDLQILSDNYQAGPLLLRSIVNHQTYVTGHPEYDSDTLNIEYHRDLDKHLTIQKPDNYYNENGQVENTWQDSSHQLYQNWLNLIANLKKTQILIKL